jgi:hypothetical protein
MRGGGDCGVSANEYSCAHGAQINFRDLTSYLSYENTIMVNGNFRFRGFAKKLTEITKTRWQGTVLTRLPKESHKLVLDSSLSTEPHQIARYLEGGFLRALQLVANYSEGKFAKSHLSCSKVLGKNFAYRIPSADKIWANLKERKFSKNSTRW